MLCRKNFRGVSRNSAVLLCSFVFLALSMIGITNVSAEDLSPPYLVNPIPEPGSFTENWYFIRTGIVDELSGVNKDSITIDINGAPPRVKPIIEQSYEGKGYIVTVILSSQEKAEKIVVDVSAYDLAEEPNIMKEQWSFFVHTVSQDYLLVGTYPENYRNLDHGTESGNIRFSWVSMESYDYFRMKFTIPDGSSGTMDISSSILDVSYSTVSFLAEGLSPEDWQILSDIGQISWRVAPIDQPDGNLLMGYSEVSNVTYVPDALPVLSRPYHNAYLDSVFPPTFEWNSVDSALDGYCVVFVKLDNAGQYTTDYKVYETPVYIRTIPMHLETWNSFDNGNWAWTVFGKLPDGTYSDFMIQRFKKD
ncbi:hypothetical protein K8T06_07620 [bacterium]|nr:hypothetical protein [bacterium]